MNVTQRSRRFGRTIQWLALAGALWGANLPAATEQLVQGNTAFALDLYAKVGADGGNLFFSPYSISTCLAMVYGGAREESANQMARVLHFDGGQAAVAAGFSDLQGQLRAIREKNIVALTVANGLWTQAGHLFLPAFLDSARNLYGANVNQVDFHTAAEPTRTAINDWVDKATMGKITDLIPPGALNAATRLVLVNAIYFKGDWAKPFKKSGTVPAPFHLTSGGQVQAPLMSNSGFFKYAEIGGVQALELPYRGPDVSMVVLLPEAGGLPKLEGSLNATKLEEFLNQLKTVEINVFLPKFKLTRQLELAPILAGMGMADPFSPQADLSGIDGARDLVISDVIHKAFVDVNEAGTEAAAATAVTVRSMAVHRQPTLVFRADHPFLFLIRENHSGSALFLGRLADPTK